MASQAAVESDLISGRHVAHVAPSFDRGDL